MTTPLPPDPLLPQYRWNPALQSGHGAYINARGRAVSLVEVRKALDTLLDGKARNIGQLAEGLRSGTLSLSEWQTAMMTEIKDAHLIGAAMERGGWANMTQSDFGRVGRLVRDEYDYLRKFGDAIAAGDVPLDGRFVRRAQLYGEAGRDTFYNFASVNMRRLEFDEIASVLHARESCMGCIEEAGKGFVPITELGVTFKPIGSRTCLSRCKCSYIYRRSASGETVAM